MSRNVQDIETYTFLANERIFLDANIWLLVYGPSPATPRRTRIYSAAWRNMCNMSCAVYIDLIVLSEFVYRYAKLEQVQTGNRNIGFKEFRRTPTFTSVVVDLRQAVNSILAYCTRVESKFLTLDIDSMLQHMETGTTDFNDQVIESICGENNLTLITDDSDFSSTNLNILTANRQLLSS